MLTSADILMLAAILCAPILAVQSQKKIERIIEKKKRRIQLFKTLMATRGSRLSPEHVNSLNMIELEFYGTTIFGIHFQSQKAKKIINAWRSYQDYLNSPCPVGKEAANQWSNSAEELFANLLFFISQYLGYNFDAVQLKRSCYTPIGHQHKADLQTILDDFLLNIISGTKSIPVQLVEDHKKKD